MWNNIKDELFNKLPSLPYLAYKKSFETDFKGIKNSDERMKLIETLAKISVHLEKGNGDTTRLRADGGLQYEDYTNLNGIAHFRITQGIRVSCQSKGDKLLLRRYGKEPDVNKNP